MVSGIRIFLGEIAASLKKLLLERKPVSGSIYDFEMTLLNGKKISLDQFRGRKLLVVNTASKCAFTRQYEDLQKLHETHHNKVAVLGFPSNDFLWQEPGTSKDIAEFCSVNYGVTFPMFEKISVTGRNKHPLFQWLDAKSGHAPGWNFCKYLISESGEVMDFFLPKVKPLDLKIVNRILQ
jgi:glutathione peroxidase